LGLSVFVLCYVQNTQAIPQQYSQDESSYSPEDPYASYYSAEEQPAEHRQQEDEGFLGFVGRTFSDMSTFFLVKG